VVLDADPESLRQIVDRALEPGVVERDQPATLLAHEMVMMVSATGM
jgi:hypothetical protein